ncbi:MAG: hypothetical protein SPI53_00340 [Erysipelotrichaceae bacterium]|nr:hypothetical protein [Erysipelotrichaceae bacterium]
MIKITQIRCEIDDIFNKKHIAKKINCAIDDIIDFEITKESLDARKDNLHYSYSVYARIKNEAKYLNKKDVKKEEKISYQLPKVISKPKNRPIVVGFGPSGIYAALILAECGLKPIVIERGKNVDQRIEDIDDFFKNGQLLPNSNVQFGEGGAGTFSDGKLTCRTSNIRVSKVMDEFIKAGANQKIAYQNRPHLGTDVLRKIIKKMRQKIIHLGGEIHFETRLESLILANNKVIGIHTDKQDFKTENVLLCIGHSASDTYENLFKQGIKIIQKDFAIGVRVEHPQVLIDKNTYGKYYQNPKLKAASYQLVTTTSNKRGVYSFCMCPGGMVIPASTINNHLSVNGMSYSMRNGRNANSAILVQIPKSDFDQGNPLDGFDFQKRLEQLGYRHNYAAPAQNIKDYLLNKVSDKLVIESSYPRNLILENMHKLFSDEVNKSLSEGFIAFDRKIKGFIDQGIMLGIESRSSSPIRVTRNDNGISTSCDGLYPCGEGAGYAGGIVSSAVDGIKQAENLINNLNNLKIERKQ